MKKALLISCFDWYEKRILPFAEAINQEYDVRIVLGDYDHINKRVYDRLEDGCEYIHVIPYKRNISISRVVSHIGFGHKINGFIKDYKPDLIYLLLPPNNTARYCLKYKKSKPDIKYILDVIDLWPESMPLGFLKNSLLEKKWINLRDNSICVADAVLTECQLYEENFRNELKIKNIFTNHLFKNQSKREELLVDGIISQNRNEIKNAVKIGYVGSINNIIDIDIIENFLRQLVAFGFDLEMHIIGAGDHREEFISMIRKYCATKYYGKIFDEKSKIEILASCDFGLNIMKPTVKVGLTIKSIDYFSYGLPIINNIQADTAELVEKYGLGINYTTDFSKDDILSLQQREKHENVYKTYSEYFTKDAYKKRLEVILSSII